MWKRWVEAVREWAHQPPVARPVRIGLAFGGGFSRCLSHIGILQVLEEHKIPIHAIAGISSGAIVAGSYASGMPIEHMIASGSGTTFASYARWTLSRMGLASSHPMEPWLRTCLRATRFEDMRIPLAIVATDLTSGIPVVFKGQGDIIAPIRASCAYPGLFRPVRIGGRALVDGGISVTVPVQAVRDLGATHVIAVYLRSLNPDGPSPANLLQVVTQCFSILQDRAPMDNHRAPELLLEPRVACFGWNDFHRAAEIVAVGREAALAALPVIESWIRPAPQPAPAPQPQPGRLQLDPS